jgi:hypothetical protein
MRAVLDAVINILTMADNIEVIGLHRHSLLPSFSAEKKNSVVIWKRTVYLRMFQA